MSTNPVGPVVLRGALVTLDGRTIKDVVRFQYNPESIKRSFTISPRSRREGSGSGGYAEIAPGQTIAFKAYFDATDKLGAGDTFVTNLGLSPELAVLEKLIYPARADVRSRDEKRDSGELEISPIKILRAMLIWGKDRAFPIEITSLSIDEEAFDAKLNPIRATADITVTVQSYLTAPDDDDYKRFGAYHDWLENAAQRFGTQAVTSDNGRLQELVRRRSG
jgi:hypothetical protein